MEFFGGEALIFTKFFRGKPKFFRGMTSNVILLAIEYFIDSKGERQNIKLYQLKTTTHLCLA